MQSHCEKVIQQLLTLYLPTIKQHLVIELASLAQIDQANILTRKNRNENSLTFCCLKRAQPQYSGFEDTVC